MKSQVGCCFYIEGQEFIYEGLFEEEYTGMTCNKCNKPIKGKVHVFNSADGYNNGSYESRFYGNTCAKSIIQAGYVKS